MTAPVQLRAPLVTRRLTALPMAMRAPKAPLPRRMKGRLVTRRLKVPTDRVSNERVPARTAYAM